MDMRTPAVAAAALAAALTLTACADQAPQPVAQTTVTQQCVINHPDGTVELVDDDLCEDHSHGTVWWYGGTTYVSHGHTYVRSGSHIRRPNVIVVVRPPAQGGSPRTQGTIRSYNDHVRQQMGTTPTYKPRSDWSGGSVKSGDDRRTSTTTRTTTTTTRSTTTRSSTSGRR